jgi:hypothetical protein
MSSSRNFHLVMIVIAAIAMAAGCLRPRDDRAAGGLDGPTALFVPDAAPAPVCTAVDQAPVASLQVMLRTTAVGGRFAPRDVGAIWIEPGNGVYVKTLARWGNAGARWPPNPRGDLGADRRHPTDPDPTSFHELSVTLR